MLHGAASFRGASSCLKWLAEFLPGTDRTPTAWCAELWIFRIGLYEILRRKEPAEDRVWIVDHTVQIGTTKCLVIVSVRLSWWQQQRRPLEHGDLEVLSVEPVEHSDGHRVQVQLEWKAEEVGVPREIISDHGSDLKRGIEAFQQTHPETAGVYDIAHKVACLLKHELEADERWSEFLRRMSETKSQLQQTALAFLMPPSPRAIACQSSEKPAKISSRVAVSHPADNRLPRIVSFWLVSCCRIVSAKRRKADAISGVESFRIRLLSS